MINKNDLPKEMYYYLNNDNSIYMDEYLNKINDKINNNQYYMYEIFNFFIFKAEQEKIKFKDLNGFLNYSKINLDYKDKNNDNMLCFLLSYINEIRDDEYYKFIKNQQSLFLYLKNLDAIKIFKLLEENNNLMLLNEKNNYGNSISWEIFTFYKKNYFYKIDKIKELVDLFKTNNVNLIEIQYKNNDLIDLFIDIQNNKNKDIYNLLINYIPINNKKNRHFSYSLNKEIDQLFFDILKNNKENIFNKIIYNKTGYETNKNILEHWVELKKYQTYAFNLKEFFNYYIKNENEIQNIWVNEKNLKNLKKLDFDYEEKNNFIILFEKKLLNKKISKNKQNKNIKVNKI